MDKHRRCESLATILLQTEKMGIHFPSTINDFNDEESPPRRRNRIFSIKNVFLKAQELRNTLSPTEAKVLWDLYKQMLTTSVKHDLIVYLHLGPHLVLKRIKERGRLEERSIDFDYLKALHRLHDTWLNFSPSPRVIILDARLPTGLLIANLDAELGKIL